MSPQSNLDADSVPYIFFLFIGLIGIVGSYAYWDETGSHMLETAGWQRVSCEIVQSEVGSTQISWKPYAFDVRYRYTWDGKEYEGSRYRRVDLRTGMTFEDRAEVEALIRRFPEGSRTACFVNPDNPSRSVLDRRPILHAYAAVIPGAILLFSAIGLILTARWLPDPVRRKRLPKVILGTFGGLAVVVGIGMGGVLAVGPALAWLDARDWSRVDAVVQRSEVQYGSGAGGGNAYWDLQYRFEVDGETYYGNDYSPLARGTVTGLESLAAQYPPETETTAWFDPANPDRAVLTRDVPFVRMLPAIGMLLFAFLVGGAFAFGAFRYIRSR